MANVLVVQEPKLYTFDAAEALQLSGHHILVAKSITEAAEIVREGRVDVIVSAVHFDMGSVFDLLKICKRSVPERHIPFLIFSNSETVVGRYLNEALATTSKVLGADQYLPGSELTPQRLCSEIEKFTEPEQTAFAGSTKATALHWQATQALRNRQFASAERLFKLLLEEMTSPTSAFPDLDIATVQNELASAQEGQGKSDEAKDSRNAIPDF